MWKKFEETVDEMMCFTSGKTVVLWGYERSGWFIEHLFKIRNRPIEYIIDDGGAMMAKLRINNSLILADLNKDTHAVLVTFGEDEKARTILSHYGYEEGVNYIFVRDLFFKGNKQRKLSYYNWLEHEYGIDIIGIKGIDSIQGANADSNPYSAGVDHSLMNALYNFSFNEEDGVFDFGCGKGGALLLFNKRGVRKLGGVEYDKELYNIARNNFRTLGIENERLINSDASLLGKELDEYNYFYIYNSFQGETFDEVIKRLEESGKRRKRKMTLIYTGPFCHQSVLDYSSFVLSKTIQTDFVVRYINIYVRN